MKTPKTFSCNACQVSGIGHNEALEHLGHNHAKPHHTPTPWEESQLRAFTIQGPDGDYIAQMFYGSKGENKTLALANSAFIVQAVNSYEELMRVALYASYLMCDKTNNCPHCLSEKAIAKAEGK